MHRILVFRLYFQYTLYMFRTVSVHPQEQSFICCMSYLVYADTAYKKIAPEDGLIQSETCRAYIENKV